MPSQYQYLLTRLRIEQTRLLTWGEHIGLLETSLEASSAQLGLNHNIINDILLEMHSAFRACVNIRSEYSPFAARHSPSHRQDSTTRKAFLERVLAIPDLPSRATARLQWAIIRRDTFEELINKLIALNERVESILDRDALGEIRAMQVQSNLMLLQVTDKVTQLRVLVEALNISRQPQCVGYDPPPSSLHPAPTGREFDSTVASLAQFKAESMLVDGSIAQQAPNCIDLAEIMLERSQGSHHAASNVKIRSSGRYQQRRVWLEWRQKVEDHHPSPETQEQIDARVRQLTALLCNKDKPPLFRSPRCLGYVRDDSDPVPRHALVYDMESCPRTNCASLQTLRGLLTSQQMPSLGKRFALARAIVESVFYLHAVSWLHKDIKSDNIVFIRRFNQEAPVDGEQLVDTTSPILSGFDYSRPDLIDERSFRYDNAVVTNELYRHPDLLQLKTKRYRKSYDMYSLGLVLAEIALWQSVEAIIGIEVRQTQLLKISKTLAKLNEQGNALRLRLAAQVGDGYADAICHCVAGGHSIDTSLSSGLEETDTEVRASMQEAFFEKVVKRFAKLSTLE